MKLRFNALALLTLIAAMLLPFGLEAKEVAGAAIPDYDIEGAGTGAQGSYLVTVTVVTKKKNLSDDELKKAAVHGVLFRGFKSKANRQNQKPLAGSATAEDANKRFFDSFFGTSGDYKKYASTVGGGRRVVKDGKLYRVSVNMQVDKDGLRRDLQEAGVIKSLGSAF